MPDDALRAGLSEEATWVVTEDMSPPHLRGILSTSRLIGLCEDTCLRLIDRHLTAGETTVGTRVDFHHVGVARAGEEVTIRVQLTRVFQQRLLSFTVEVTAPGGVVATGTHQRLVVDRERFSRRAAPPVAAARKP
jgi:fluoroacetyl-CoA thioesterase